MKKAARGALHALVWLAILSSCIAILAALGLFGAVWRFFKWLVEI
jgi:hypothetical protein